MDIETIYKLSDRVSLFSFVMGILGAVTELFGFKRLLELFSHSFLEIFLVTLDKSWIVLLFVFLLTQLIMWVLSDYL